MGLWASTDKHLTQSPFPGQFLTTTTFCIAFYEPYLSMRSRKNSLLSLSLYGLSILQYIRHLFLRVANFPASALGSGLIRLFANFQHNGILRGVAGTSKPFCQRLFSCQVFAYS
jgi:hypothetical protein